MITIEGVFHPSFYGNPAVRDMKFLASLSKPPSAQFVEISANYIKFVGGIALGRAETPEDAGSFCFLSCRS